MSTSEPAPATDRPTPRILVAGLLVSIAAIAVACGSQLLAPRAATAAAPTDVPRTEHRPTPGSSTAAPAIDAPGAERRTIRPAHGGGRGEADGAVPAGTTVFDDEVPGVANLDPALLGALRKAAAASAHDGVQLTVNSGWRSRAYQDQQLRQAISKYGSEKEAARWVATPKASSHVSGDAVDIGPFEATAWLTERGARYGLCQIYRNEPWHYELRPNATDHGCPPMYADPTQDPRMQQ